MSEFAHLPFGNKTVEEFVDDSKLRASGTYVEVLGDNIVRLYNPAENLVVGPFLTTLPKMEAGKSNEDYLA